MNFHPETILLLAAAVGEFIYLYFGILAASAVFKEKTMDEMMNLEMKQSHFNGQEEDRFSLRRLGWLNFFTNIIDIFQIGAQTLLLFLAESSISVLTWCEDRSKKKSLLRELLWYLCVCNFAKWVTDSFIEGHFLKNSEAKTLVFGSTRWTAITQSTYPLVLFYRFHSVHMIVRLTDTIFD